MKIGTQLVHAINEHFWLGPFQMSPMLAMAAILKMAAILGSEQYMLLICTWVDRSSCIS